MAPDYAALLEDVRRGRSTLGRSAPIGTQDRAGMEGWMNELKTYEGVRDIANRCHFTPDGSVWKPDIHIGELVPFSPAQPCCMPELG